MRLPVAPLDTDFNGLYLQCDGQVPACGNCTKSGSVCIDVDSHNADRRVSRGYDICMHFARAINDG
jgi:hypothetical protein